MTDLPPGWEWSTVGDLGEYVNGRGFKRSEWSGAGRPIIRIQNLTGSGSAFNYFAGELEDRYVVPTGALLVSWAATLGVYRWDGPEGALNQHIFRVRSFINEDFHRYLLEHALDVMQSDTHGSGMVHITRGRFDATPAPLPPLPEQERIVAAIEEAFSKLDAGEAGLRAVRQLLGRMRQAILAAAVAGDLLPQDSTDVPATKLLADLGLETIESGPHAVPESWAWTRLGALLREPLRNGMSAPSADPSVGLPTFSITAVTTGDFSATNIKYTSGDWARATDLWAEPGDVYVQRSNTPELVGTARLYRGEPKAAIFPDLLIRVRPVEQVRPAWLEMVMSAQWCRSLLRRQAKGLAGSMPKISQPVLAALPIPLPPEPEQDRIIGEVDRQMSVVEACERAVEAGLTRSAALRRSVLKSAFEGRLVAQDSTDEPASVLLDRIRAERAAAPKANSRRAGAKA
jgi:type I restriction enzyme S subunit